MAIVPKYVVWNSTDTAEIYTITFVQGDNSPQDPGKFVELNSFRGQGSIIVEGGDTAPWDLVLDFVIQGNDYEDLIAKMDAVEATILKNTKYILKIDRTISTTKEYKVKRIEPVVFRPGERRLTIAHGTITFHVNTWE